MFQKPLVPSRKCDLSEKIERYLYRTWLEGCILHCGWWYFVWTRAYSVDNLEVHNLWFRYPAAHLDPCHSQGLWHFMPLASNPRLTRSYCRATQLQIQSLPHLLVLLMLSSGLFLVVHNLADYGGVVLILHNKGVTLVLKPGKWSFPISFMGEIVLNAETKSSAFWCSCRQWIWHPH